MQIETWVKDRDGAVGGVDAAGVFGCVAAQGDARLVWRQAVESGAVERGEGFEVVESAVFFEDLREDRESVGRGEAAGTAAGLQFGAIGMRRAVGAEKEARVA